MNDNIILKAYDINDKTYLVINEIKNNNNHYLYLSNKSDDKDMMIKKVVNGCLEPLTDENEIQYALKLLLKD